MAASPKKSLALDTNLLLDLAGEKDFSHDFREEFSSRGYSLLVPPTVVAELAFFASLKDAPQQQMANVALEKLSSWKCLPPMELGHLTSARRSKITSESADWRSTERKNGNGISLTW